MQAPVAPPTRWKPLLAENAAERALESIHEIAAYLRASLESIRKDAAAPPPSRRYTSAFELGEGAAGIAVFFAYLDRTGIEPQARDTAFEYLNIATDALASQAMSPSFFSGFTGIGWAARHISKMMGEEAGDLTEELDRAVEGLAGQSPWRDDYDLISGLVGLGVYCLEQTGSAPAQRALGLIVDRLAELAEQTDFEARWFTRPEMLIEEQRKEYPGGYYNLGLAHGVPGIIALLGRTFHAGVAREKAGLLLERAVNWLLKQRLPETYNSSFSGFLGADGKAEDCRLAWCYGDGGVATALMSAARNMGREAWETEALAIARRASQRDRTTCGARDACFCHGTAGLAHIMNRFYQATGDEAFAGGARYWLDRTLELRKPGTGAAGYSVWTANNDLEIVFMGRPGVIEGISGVGLTLLAAITSFEPSWDRIFQTDIPLY